MKNYRVLISTNDAKGLVHKVSGVFYDLGLNMLSNNEFVDKECNKFFMRSEVQGNIEQNTLQNALSKVVPTDAHLQVITPQKKNIILLATKEFHALGDILIRYEAGELDANIVAVVSNYNTLQPLVEKFNLPFHHVDHTDLSREEHEANVIKTIHNYSNIDYLVLAKYMRILTENFVATFDEKIINIHHSFLPAFIGANPYKQAYERGVKIIGATAHFVNNELDEGPIISQDIIHVDHSQSWQEMRNFGRDVEKIVLSRALKLVFEDRIFVYNNKTVIF